MSEMGEAEEGKLDGNITSQQQLMGESPVSYDQPSTNNTKVKAKGISTVVGGFIVCLSLGSGKDH